MAIVETNWAQHGTRANQPGLAVTIDPADLAQLEEELSQFPGKIKEAIAGAINKVIPKSRTRLVKALAQRINLRPTFIRRRMGIRKANKTTMVGFLQIRNKKIDLVQFGAKGDKDKIAPGGQGVTQNERGVMFRVYKTGASEMLLHGFINRGKKTKRLAVFKRASGGWNGLEGRYPIYTKYGPDMLTLVKSEGASIDREIELSSGEMHAQLLSQTDRILKRRKIDR